MKRVLLIGLSLCLCVCVGACAARDPDNLFETTEGDPADAARLLRAWVKKTAGAGPVSN